MILSAVNKKATLYAADPPFRVKIFILNSQGLFGFAVVIDVEVVVAFVVVEVVAVVVDAVVVDVVVVESVVVTN